MQGLPFLILALIAVPLWRGYVLSVLWAWFLTDYFGIQPITIPVALGLALLISMFLPAPSVKTESPGTIDWEKAWEGMASLLLSPLLILGVAWILKGFM